MENDKSKQTVSVETLRALGFSDDLINEALRREQRSDDVDPPPDLYDRITRKAGDRMPDGTIYAGISPDTNKPIYAMPADAPATMKWKAAMKYASKLDAHDHKDWRVPTKGELNVLWQNRDKSALKGTFNESSSDTAGWYWTSEENGIDDPVSQCFRNGFQGSLGKSVDYTDYSSLRCVRG